MLPNIGEYTKDSDFTPWWSESFKEKLVRYFWRDTWDKPMIHQVSPLLALLLCHLQNLKYPIYQVPFR